MAVGLVAAEVVVAQAAAVARVQVAAVAVDVQAVVVGVADIVAAAEAVAASAVARRVCRGRAAAVPLRSAGQVAGDSRWADCQHLAQVVEPAPVAPVLAAVPSRGLEQAVAVAGRETLGTLVAMLGIWLVGQGAEVVLVAVVLPRAIS